MVTIFFMAHGEQYMLKRSLALMLLTCRYILTDTCVAGILSLWMC